MKPVCHIIAAVLFVMPVMAPAQEAAKLGAKQKAWMVANFRTGLDCSGVHGGALSFSGMASFDASGRGGVEVSIAPGDGGVPTVSAHAINTKGTGATNGRTAAAGCPAAASIGSVASCTVAGDAHAPMVSASIPLSVFGDVAASRYVGTVTIVKRGGPDAGAAGASASKKGYDYYQAQSDLSSAGASVNPGLTYIATCDSSALKSKGSKASLATYDLAVSKK